MLSCTSNKASAVFGVAGLSGADLHVTALVMNPALMMPTSCFAFWCEISHRCHLQPWCHCGISAHAREKQQPALLGHSLSNPPWVPHLKSSVCLFMYLFGWRMDQCDGQIWSTRFLSVWHISQGFVLDTAPKKWRKKTMCVFFCF